MLMLSWFDDKLLQFTLENCYKKAANRKGFAAYDRSVSYFFYGLYI